jgi:CBS domain-containing protein
MKEPVSNLTAAELDLIERFISAYNSIDSHLQSLDGGNSSHSFRGLVDAYARRHRWWQDVETLRICAGLRNILVHDKLEPYQYPCIPALELVNDIESARDRLLHPKRAIPLFEGEVVTIQPTDTLSHVLRLIDALGYGHFPVYEHDAKPPYSSRFLGVLTENGITRRMAEHIAGNKPFADLADEPVKELISREEKRLNYEWAPQGETVEAIRHRFHENTYLEAVLLTAKGHSQEKLLGIVTRQDILRVAY